MPTIAHYAALAMNTRSITFIRSYAKESQCLGYACVTRSDFTTGRLADRSGEPRSADFSSLLATICHN